MDAKIILGTVQFGMPYGINNTVGQPSMEDAFKILNRAHEAGIHTLDTAKAYGNAMQVIGDYHRQSPNRFAIINKFHTTSLLSDALVKEELDLLSISYYEAYLFHAYSDYETSTTQVWNELMRLKEKGLVNQIGVSVYTNQQLDSVIKDPRVDLVQVPYNLLDNAFQRAQLFAEANSKGKCIHTRSAYLQGLFFKDPSNLPARLQALQPYLNDIHRIANKYRTSVSQLALQYVLREKHIRNVLIGVDSMLQLETNISDSQHQLPDACFAEIDAIQVNEVNLLNPANW